MLPERSASWPFASPLRAVGLPRTVNGLAVRVDAGTRHWFSGEYERPVAAFLRHHIVAGSEVWNVGANIGVYALQLGAWVGPDGLVLAFEPNPFAARLLTENVRLNGLHDRIEILRLAIGESSGEADLHVRAADPMSRIGRPNPVLAVTQASECRSRRSTRWLDGANGGPPGSSWTSKAGRLRRSSPHGVCLGTAVSSSSCIRRHGRGPVIHAPISKRSFMISDSRQFL